VEAEYDVFLSFTGPDRRTGRVLAKTLRASGIRVFFDEDDIALFSSITMSLESALASSKFLVAYYSVQYAARRACQAELIAAFLAGLREGDPLRRIVVINPERSSEHIVPIELADARYARSTSRGHDTKALTLEILSRMSTISGTIGSVSLRTHPRWFGRRPGGKLGRVGRRFRELWSLHGALHSTNLPVYLDPNAAWCVALCGLPGAGKTTLAAGYASQFGAAYPGGVFWLSLAGSKGTRADVLDQYRREVGRIAHDIGADMSRNPIAALTDRLADEQRPSLWIVDDLPPDFDLSVLDRLLLPAGSAVRTVLISDEDVFDDKLPVVNVGSLSTTDARAVLSHWRPPDGRDERLECDRLVRKLGCHAGAVAEAGRWLQDRQGLATYDEIDVGARDTDTLLPKTTAAMRGLGQRLTPGERLVLDVAVICQSRVLPASLIKRIGIWRGIDMGTALVRLRRRSVAQRLERVWWLHPLVVQFQNRGGRAVDSHLTNAVVKAVGMLEFDRRLTRKERDVVKFIAHNLEEVGMLPASGGVRVIGSNNYVLSDDEAVEHDFDESDPFDREIESASDSFVVASLGTLFA
jgi:hypothetical protein